MRVHPEVGVNMQGCPECDGAVSFSTGTEIGEILPCPDCGVELEVRSLEPVTLQLAPKVEEDWGE